MSVVANRGLPADRAELDRRAAALRQPRWAGTHALGFCWKACAARISAGSPHSVLVAERLQHARPVCFEPEQVDALPDWDSVTQAWEFMEDVQLPAPVTFCDFAAHADVAHVSYQGATVNLLGALLVQDSGGRELTVLTFLRDGDAVLATSALHAVFDHAPSAGLHDDPGGERVLGLTGLLAGEPAALPGVLAPGLAPLQLADDEDPVAWARQELAVSLRALAAVTLLEVDGVVLEPVALERRDAKRAAKRGWPIANVVRIRSRASANTAGAGAGQARYSHRFWVIGHRRHYPAGTRLGDADGGRHLTPCSRPQCGGACRKSRVRSYIKGPDDKPLVAKTLLAPGARQELP